MFRIASCASAKRACPPLEAASSALDLVTLAFGDGEVGVGAPNSPLALVWTASTAAVPASATSTAAPAAVTPVRCRVN